MALIVEDGTGKPDAESYISVADATAYFAARGNETWADLADDTAREVLLRKATDYMQAAYAGKWAGQRVSAYQALDWPRAYVARRDVVGGYGPAPVYWPNDEVPETVRRACAELAVRASAGDLLADQGAQVKQETVGPISVTYADGARQWIRYAMVDGLLAGLLRDGGGAQIPVVRA